MSGLGERHCETVTCSSSWADWSGQKINDEKKYCGENKNVHTIL